MATGTPQSERPVGVVGIVALAGGLPVALARALAARGQRVFILGVVGIAGSEIESFDHGWVRPFEVGRFFGALRAAGVRDIVFAGAMRRPRWGDFRIDVGTLRALPLIAASNRGEGDDTTVRRISSFVAREGMRVRSIAELAPDLVAAPGPFGRAVPSTEALEDIRIGLALLDAAGPFDVGQAVVVHRRRVLAVEAAEGTDAMIARIGDLRRSGRFPVAPPSGVLVKAPKPQQALSDDMPVVGSSTIDAAIAAGLSGIALQAGGVVVLGVEDMVARADAERFFLVGVPPASRAAR